MSFPQQKFREIIFQLLFCKDFADPKPEDLQQFLAEELAISKRIVKLAQQRVEKILEKSNEIDRLISSASTSYQFNRIQKTELNILRLGIFELLFDEDIPSKVAIAEAIRLARKFSTPESASFINAVLDSLLIKESSSPEELQKNLANTFEEMLVSEELANRAIVDKVENHANETKNSDGSPA